MHKPGQVAVLQEVTGLGVVGGSRLSCGLQGRVATCGGSKPQA
jgi:hypothetical protein